MIKSIEYDSFGNILSDSNPTFAVPFGFAGGLHDRDTGLVKFGFRDYDPDIGRWTAKDPIFFAGGDTDLYGYVLNDPINFTDPFGLWTLQIGLGLNAGAGIGTTKSFGFAISQNSKTGVWQFGFYEVLGGGLHLGATGDIVADFTLSANDSIEELSGCGVTAGASVSAFRPFGSIGLETNVPFDKNVAPSITISPGIGIGTPVEAHVYFTYTAVQPVLEW